MNPFAPALLAWYEQTAAELPWRGTDSPYHVWLSEIMLQQTQVETVKPYYARFLDAYPTVEALAAAPLDDVLKRWEGLGYYSRARNLHRAAQIVAEQYGGRFPSTVEELQKLPGIGRYTAGAIASIAFG
ncbi:MAG TPA: A/G-specific adenine glycosylase, partial [Oceanobacillus sp.]|nr:A/G-specific adenine glycosylase [Oceanobacillus sp.]